MALKEKKRLPATYRWNMITQSYQLSGWYTVPLHCNGFMVTNTGDVLVTVNDQILNAGVPGTSLGDSKTFGGNEGELYDGTLKVAFANPTAGVAPNIEVVYKVYTNILDE